MHDLFPMRANALEVNARTTDLLHARRDSLRVGGYLNRASDAPPGNTVIWRGMSRLTDIELGFLLGTENVGN